MSGAWLLKSRQMSEAGKEILVSEALSTHMRSSRDRASLMEILQEPRSLEDTLSFFSAFYLYNYQGLRLKKIDVSSEYSIEKQDELAAEERRQLELEIRQLLGNKQREEIDISRLASEFVMDFCDRKIEANTDPVDNGWIKNLLLDYLKKIPNDYSPNAGIDLILELTAWGDEWRDDFYMKASGLKETALSLRDELLREHPEEVVEISVISKGIQEILGKKCYLQDSLLAHDLSEDTLDRIADAIKEKQFSSKSAVAYIKLGHQVRAGILDFVEQELDIPQTIEEFETNLSHEITKLIDSTCSKHPEAIFPVISVITGFESEKILSLMKMQGLSDPNLLMSGLLIHEEEDAPSEEASGFSQEELQEIERSLRTLEKLEYTLEKPVKGMLGSRGLRASDLEKVTIDILIRDPNELIAIEQQVLDEMKKKIRVPPPDEVARFLEARELVKSGALSSMGVTSSSDMVAKRKHGETMKELRHDMVWHFMTSQFRNLTRVVEIYLRSKQDLLRMKALLKSIYEKTDMELQFLREEILIDLASDRIHEMKMAHPELDASTICSWMHARFSYQSISAARDELRKSPSPVFSPIVNAPLELDGLEFNNYTIAFDIMQRFLRQERHELMQREEQAIEVERQREKMIQSKKTSIDVLSFIYTKAHTLFRAIGRVGTKGLEWDTGDSMKTANLLSFYINENRGRQICQVCGETPSGNKCSSHGKGNMLESNDLDNMSVFVMRSISDIKSGLIGPTAQTVSWDEARAMVQREIGRLKRAGKVTSRTNLKQLMPGEINYIIGPAIADMIGKYFNESLVYAARRADLA